MPGFENGREELRSAASVAKDRQAIPGADGDSRPLDTPACPRCGSYLQMYVTTKGDRQVCQICGR